MKKTVLLLRAGFVTSIVLGFAANAFADKAKTPGLVTERDKVSYIIGHQIGSSFNRNGMDVSLELLLRGLKESLAGKKPSMQPDEIQKIMAAYHANLEKTMSAKRAEQGAKNAKIGKDFLEKNKQKPGVVTLPSGLQYKIITEGKGPIPKLTDTVITQYRGTLIDGTEFDSSHRRNQPATFPVNGVIKGWIEALQLMKVGSKWQLFVPSELAYGTNGAGEDIGPQSTLIFEIELIGIQSEKGQHAQPPMIPEKGQKLEKSK